MNEKIEKALEELSGLANIYTDSRMGPTLSKIVATIKAALLEHDALKAEMERLTHLHKLDHSLADQWLARAEAAEATLALAKPLLEAAMKVEHLTFMDGDDLGGVTKEAIGLFDSVLAYRAAVQNAAKEKKNG